MLAVTALSSYLYCPRKLFLEKVFGLVKIPKAAMIKGTVRHRVYELINLAEKDLVSDTAQSEAYQSIRRRFEDRYRALFNQAIDENKGKLQDADVDPHDYSQKVWPLIVHESEKRAGFVHSFMLKTGLFGAELWDKLIPKIKSEVRIESLSLGIRGIIDEVRVYENELVPFELKTGKAPREGVWPGHKLQVAAYILMLQDKFDMPIKEGFISYLDHRQDRQICMNPFLRDEVIETVSSVQKLINGCTLPTHDTNKNKCRACQLQKECYDEALMARLLEEKCNQKL